jgi:hypothetical protein
MRDEGGTPQRPGRTPAGTWGLRDILALTAGCRFESARGQDRPVIEPLLTDHGILLRDERVSAALIRPRVEGQLR